MKSQGAGSRDPAATPLTSPRIKAKARELGFDLCGVAAADSFPELSFLREWLDQGYAGEMGWLAESVELRSDVRRVLPGARSVIMTGTLYNTDRPYSDQLPAGRRSRVAARLGRRLPPRALGPPQPPRRLDARGLAGAVRDQRARGLGAGAGAGLRAVRRARLDRARTPA